MALRKDEFKQKTTEEPIRQKSSIGMPTYDIQQHTKFLSSNILNNNDIFNTCAAQADITTFINACDYIVSQNREDILGAVDTTGATPLHHAVRFNKHAGVIHYLLYSLKEKADDVSKWKNNQGQWPIQLLAENSEISKSIVKELLEKHMARHSMPSLSQKLDVNVVLAEYSEDCKEDPRLAGDLRHLVAMTNKVLDEVKFSATHLNSPTYPYESNSTLKTSLILATHGMRTQVDKTLYSINNKFETNIFFLEKKGFNNATMQTYIKLHGKRAREFTAAKHAIVKFNGIACCEEMAVTFVNHSNTANPNKYIQTYHIKNGDHVFIGINRDLFADSHTPSSIMIFADPWSKTIALSRNYWEKLKYWEQYKDPDTGEHKFNLVGPLNPKVHKVDARKLFFQQPEANWTNLELLRACEGTKRSLFLQARDHEEKNKFHDAALSCDWFTNKIYFHFLHELKNETVVDTVLTMTDSTKKTALHYAINNQDPRIFQIYLKEYHHHFKEKFQTILLTDNNSFLNQVLAAENKAVMSTLVDFFKFNLIKIDKLITEFLSTKPTDNLHLLLFNLCSTQLNASEINALLIKHPTYQPFFTLHGKLQRMKNEIKPNARFFSKNEDQLLRLKILDSLPERIVFDIQLAPNIKFEQLEEMEMQLQKLNSGTTVTQSLGLT